MRHFIKFKLARIGIILVMCAVFGAVVMLLWNSLMPDIFRFPQLNYLQATGLLVLARILFGGHIGWHGGRHDDRHHRGHHFHHNELREKWMNMSEEERKEFFEKGMYRRHHHDCPRNGETEKS